jgi:hypothetical protein
MLSITISVRFRGGVAGGVNMQAAVQWLINTQCTIQLLSI